MIQKAVKDFGLKSPLLENKNKEFAASLFAKTPEELARSKRAAERVLGKRRNPRPQHLFKKDEDNEEFNRLENKRERARDRAREAEDKGDWDEWNRQENERERSRDQLRDIEDNEDAPKRSITGMRQKLDALAAAQLAGSKHKPYVSSFVGDGGKKIFAILGSDGKIVHKTHNKQAAYQWLKDNYENV